MPSLTPTPPRADASNEASPRLDAVLPHARFREHHERIVHAPHERVVEAMCNTRVGEIRLFAPLMSIRSFPARLRGRDDGAADASMKVLDLFLAEGFVELDQHHTVASSSIVMGSIGRFWHPTENAPVRFPDPSDFFDFDQPGFARLVFDLTATDLGDATRLTTETRVVGTSIDAERRFQAYWWIIRGPSGAIRRSWLAAIDRRAQS